MLNQPIKSNTVSLTPGQPANFTEFANLRGPDFDRVVIDRIWIRIFGVITVATAAWNGADVARILSGVSVDSNANNSRWNLTGLKSRLASFHFNGEDAVVEHANVAVGAAQAIDYFLCIPMTKRFIFRGKDVSMPADMLKQVLLQVNTLGAMQTGTTVLSAATLQATLLLDWHEESSLELKTEDQVASQEFGSAIEARIMCSGPLHDVLLCREASTAGGDVVTAVTDIQCAELGLPTISRQELVAVHRYKRKLGNTSLTQGAEVRYSPVTAGLVIPILSSDDETSIFAGKVVKSALFKCAGTPANSALIYRQILPRDTSTIQQQLTTFGVTADEANNIRIKTKGKSKQHPLQWTKREAMFLPTSLPLAKAQ